MSFNPLHSAQSAEHYTPREVVEAGRYVMGHFDLDPASSEYANYHVVKARNFYTKEDDGLSRPWFGRVFLNAPGDEDGDVVLAKPRKFWERGVGFWQHHEVECLWQVGFNLGQLAVFQQSPASPLSFVTCFVRERWCFLVRPFELIDDGVHRLHTNGCEAEGPCRKACKFGKPKKVKREMPGPPIPGEAPTHANYLTFIPPKDDDVARPMMRRFLEVCTDTSLFGGKCAGQLVRPIVL